MTVHINAVRWLARCRSPLTLWIACLLAVRNQRILDAHNARQQDNTRRAAAGLPPRPDRVR